MVDMIISFVLGMFVGGFVITLVYAAILVGGEQDGSD